MKFLNEGDTKYFTEEYKSLTNSQLVTEMDTFLNIIEKCKVYKLWGTEKEINQNFINSCNDRIKIIVNILKTRKEVK